MSDQTNPLAALAVDDSTTPTSPEAEAVQPDGATGADGQGSPDAPSTSTSAVQPDGQGQPDAETGLYDLSTVPEEYRSDVERIAKDIDRNANAKFQEHAAYRETWAPYEALGINELGPEGAEALLKFAEDVSAEDKDSAREALLNLAQGLGIDLGVTPGEPGDGEEPDPVASLEQRVSAWEAKEAERQEQQELAQLRAEADKGYRSEFTAVEQLNGKPFGVEPGPNGEPSERQQLINLAVRFQADHDEPIKAAYQWMQQIRGQAEAALVNGQPTPPRAAEPGGRASSSVQPVDSFEEAERLHKARNSVHA